MAKRGSKKSAKKARVDHLERDIAREIGRFAIIVTQDKSGGLTSLRVPVDDLVDTMSRLGHKFVGFNDNPRHRADLRGAPKFSGILGPMYGGSASEPWRYESTRAYGELSR